jgi:hypothetical protein
MRSRRVYIPYDCVFICADQWTSRVTVRLAEKVILAAVIFSELP